MVYLRLIRRKKLKVLMFFPLTACVHSSVNRVAWDHLLLLCLLWVIIKRFFLCVIKIYVILTYYSHFQRLGPTWRTWHWRRRSWQWESWEAAWALYGPVTSKIVPQLLYVSVWTISSKHQPDCWSHVPLCFYSLWWTLPTLLRYLRLVFSCCQSSLHSNCTVLLCWFSSTRGEPPEGNSACHLL